MDLTYDLLMNSWIYPQIKRYYLKVYTSFKLSVFLCFSLLYYECKTACSHQQIALILQTEESLQKNTNESG